MLKAHIPMPLQIVIDDVGWWTGTDGHERNEPYRTGVDREHVPADYEAIASLGRQLGMRPQAAMILGEWDTTNLLRSVPGSTWLGEKWDNSRRSIEPMREVADIFRRESDHIELTLHGIGHEYWDHAAGGKMNRAEWYSRDGYARPREHVQGVIDAFAAIMQQHDLGPFPESFVPCAFAHRFEDEVAELLCKAGIRYNSTVFRTMYNAEQTQHTLVGVEHGIITIDRGNYGPAWYQFSSDPFAMENYDLSGPVCGLHWPNVLHADPARNEEAVSRWVTFLKPFNDLPDRMLAPNTASGWTQTAYHCLTDMKLSGRQITLNFLKLRSLPLCNLLDRFVLKVVADSSVQFAASGASITEQRYHESGGFHVLTVQVPDAGAQAIIELS